jgi:hypothetical protein
VVNVVTRSGSNNFHGSVFEARFEFFNIFNHAQFLNPNGNFASSNFGNITGARDPRIGQVALKVIF